MTLLEEIQAKCSPELIAAQEHGQIAAIVSVGRTRPSGKEVGIGTILETMGLGAGNAMLDAIYGDQMFRYVKPLLEQGRLIVSSPLVAATLQGLVQANVIQQADADKLLALATVPSPVSTDQVIQALKGA